MVQRKRRMMQISMKCSVAVHCLIFIHEARGRVKVTSTLLSQSTGCNPVVIRNTLSALKKAGILTVARGTGGAELSRLPAEITLYDIYHALEPEGLDSLIGIHACQGRACPVAQNIRRVLEPPYQAIEEAVRRAMEGVTLESMLGTFHALVEEPAEKTGMAPQG